MSERTRLNANEDAEIRRDDLSRLTQSDGYTKYLAPKMKEIEERAEKILHDEDAGQSAHDHARGRANAMREIREHLETLLRRAEDQAKGAD